MTQILKWYTSEFNPYHLGHQSLIVQTRQAGATHSSNYERKFCTTRNACFDKWVRTNVLSAGVDLVIELPLPGCFRRRNVCCRRRIYCQCIGMCSSTALAANAVILKHCLRLLTY
ncbi:MAG: nucleotidyltransferase family protein [Acutalibacteraceae bacterium]